MAGAITIPIKARAIKKSCMISVPIRRSAELDNQPAKAPAAHSPTNEDETPQRESPRLKLMPNNRCAADLPMHHRRYERILEIARKAGRIRGSGRGRDSSESYERCGNPLGGARLTMRRDAAHRGV
jgi:hypothetical protein